jgi:glutamate synthase (NADPH/NADH) small chain
MQTHVIEEARRCLQCKKAKCRDGCPVNTPINEVIGLLLAGGIDEAGERLFRNNPLSVVCSLICPHERFCEGHCILGKKGMPIQVSEIEQYISDYWLERHSAARNIDPARKVAIIGSGPAGITVACLLAARGHAVTIFEAEDRIGGIMRYGIPEYRLPKAILDRLHDALLASGVKFRPNTLIGPVITIDDLFRDGYKAVFIGTGVWSPKPLRIKGETLGHVHYAINYLKNPDAYRLGRRLVVIGAGNVAMDVARTAIRKGAREVYILYRKGADTVSAEAAELEYARVEGVRFEYFRMPLEIIDEGLRVQETRPADPADPAGEVEAVPGTESVFAADSVIIAISQSPRSNIVSNTTGIDTKHSGLLVTDDCGHTTRDGVFASGDVVTGARTVVEAVFWSKKAANAIEQWVQQASTPCRPS